MTRMVKPVMIIPAPQKGIQPNVLSSINAKVKKTMANEVTMLTTSDAVPVA